MTTLADLRSTNPGVAMTTSVGSVEDSYGGTRDAAAAAGSSASANAVNAEATGYNAQTGEVDSSMLVENRLNDILATDSVNMRRAAQIGQRRAGARGLLNSSIAAGAAMGEMTDRALPIAQQDADTSFRNSLENRAAINRASEFSATAENAASQVNAQLGTQVELDNATRTDAMTDQNAARETQVDMFNAESENRAQLADLDREQQNEQFNATQTNQMRAEVLRQNAELNRQFLAGNQALDLAGIQGQYQQLISSNETAARLYDSYFNSIAQAMGNADITPDRVAQYVNVQQSMLEAGLRMMDQINGLDLGAFELPGATGGAGFRGSDSTIQPTPGSGTAVTGQPTTPVPFPVAPPSSIPSPGVGGSPSTGGGSLLSSLRERAAA